MQGFWNELLTRLPVTGVLALVSGILSCAAYALSAYYWNRWRRYRLMRRLSKYAAEHGGEREVALIVSVREDIAPAAVVHLRKTERSEIPRFHVHQGPGFGNEDRDWFDYLEMVKSEIRKIRQAGVTRILFYSNVPVAMSTLIGAVLSNGPEVIVHHHSGGHYFDVGRISVETTRL